MPDLTVVVERHDHVTVVRIDRPQVHNALNAQTLREIAEAAHRARSDGTRVLVLTGTGNKAFSAGADLDELQGLDTARAMTVLDEGQRVMAEIEHSPVPVVAAVNGLALGGGFELALAASFCVVSERASFGLPESGLGLIPGYGGTQRLARVVGPNVAAHLMLTGDRLTAAQAHTLGLTALAPVPPEDLLDTALTLAERVAGHGPRAQAAILRALRVTAPTRQDLALETALAAVAVGGAEAVEGIAAFKERRAPQFADPEGS